MNNIFEQHEGIVKHYEHINGGKYNREDFSRLEHLFRARLEGWEKEQAVNEAAERGIIDYPELYTIQECFEMMANSTDSAQYQFLQSFRDNNARPTDEYFIFDDVYNGRVYGYEDIGEAIDDWLSGFDNETLYLLYMFTGLNYDWNDTETNAIAQ